MKGRLPHLAALHAREIVRNPWIWPAGAALVLLAFAFRSQAGVVGLVSLVAALNLYVPPLVLVLAAPLLARRDTWSFWSALQPAPGRAYVLASLGVAAGILAPLAAGGAVAALLLALDPVQLTLLLGILALTVILWTSITALASAITLDATRALALGLTVWALGTLAYGPAVIGIAVAFPDRPLLPLLAPALLLHPAEGLRVGLLELLKVPVLVGPVAVLLRDTLPGPTLAWGIGSTVTWSSVSLVVAGSVFANRNR